MENINLNLLIKQVDFYHAFQPIVDLSNNEIHGYEALIRSQQFNDPEKLFKHAQETNQLFELDMASIIKSFDFFKQEELRLDGLTLYLNLFPSTLMNPTFRSVFRKLRSLKNVKPGSIVFEINEAERVSNLAALKESIAELKEQGFLIALDDIGKGQATIHSTLETEPDIAKIDKYFAKDLSQSPKKQKVLQMMLQLFSDNTTMVLEGIETNSDLQTAIELGVPFAQGYYLGRPMPLNQFTG